MITFKVLYLKTFVKPRPVLFIVRNMAEIIFRENQNPCFTFRCSSFFRQSCLLWNNVERYGSDRQTADDNIVRRMRISCWVTKATDMHSAYVEPIAFTR
jgi:hypothetical protein